MTDDEAEDAQTIHPTPRNPPCQCPDPARDCHCDDDGSAAYSGWELGEWMEYGFPARVSGSIADRSYVRGAPKILAEKPNAPDCSEAPVPILRSGAVTMPESHRDVKPENMPPRAAGGSDGHP